MSPSTHVMAHAVRQAHSVTVTKWLTLRMSKLPHEFLQCAMAERL